jgi:O-antigen/teichoic acid export membrane protein
VTEGLLGLRGLLLARFLGPEPFGAWVLFRIASRYGLYASLGANRGLERELAQGRASARAGLGKPDDLSARTALGFSLIVFSALATGALVASFLVGDRVLVLGLRAYAASTVFEMLVSLALTIIRARGELRSYAQLEILGAGVQLVLVAAGAWARGLAGAFAGFVLASFLNAAIMTRRISRRPTLSGERLRRLLRIGFPQALSLLLGMSLATVDKLVVAAFGGTALLGYYAFATSMAGLAGSVAWVVRTVVFPDLYGAAVIQGRTAALRAHLDRTVLPFTRLYPPLLGLLALGIGPVVALALPQYVPAVPAARLYIFTGFTAGLIMLSALGVVAADRQRLLPVFTASGLVANAGFSAVALWLGAGIEGAAIGALLSQAACAGAVLRLTLRAAASPRPAAEALRAGVPLVWCVAAAYLLGELLPGNGLAEALVAVGAYALLLLPLLPQMVGHARRLVAPDQELAPAPPFAEEDLGTSGQVV